MVLIKSFQSFHRQGGTATVALFDIESNVGVSSVRFHDRLKTFVFGSQDQDSENFRHQYFHFGTK